MPGYWELTSPRTVLLGTLHTDVTTIAWSLSLANVSVHCAMNGIQLYSHGLAGMPFDHARNQACMNTLDHGVEWLFFLDSDVLLPTDTIFRLLSHNAPIVSGVYCRRSPPWGRPVAMRDGDWITLPAAHENPLVEVDVVGAGCMLIHNSVLRDMPPQRPGKHWFDWRVDQKGVLPQDQCLSEDFSFCRAVRASLGHKILLDTSIRCKHVGFAEFDYNDVRPLGAPQE